MTGGRKSVVGIIGGIGSGKSTVARQFQSLGASLVEADEVGHEVLRLSEVKQEARERWGEGVFGPDGEIDRQRLAEIVFEPSPSGKRERESLERLVHPLIGRRLRRRIEALRKDPRVGVIVVDAAVLLEAGWHDAVDVLVFVEAPRADRLARVREARHWDSNQLKSRELAQKPLSWKRQRADYVIGNSGSREQTLQQVERIYTTLTQDLPA
jgi:dephospho-CoA kinase